MARKQQPQESPVLKFIVDGQVFALDLEHVTGSLGLEFRKNVGMSIRAALEALSTDPDLDLMAAIVWLARSQAGEQITLDDVASKMTYQTDFAFDQSAEEPEADNDNPEA